MDEDRTVHERGAVVIRDGVISAVVPEAGDLPGYAADFASVESADYIFPGLVNAHNHLAFNALPPWDLSDVTDLPFDSVHGWRDEKIADTRVHNSYEDHVLDARDDLLSVRVVAEMAKWAEMKELVAGTTVTQGSFGFDRSGLKDPSAGFEEHIVRNVDLELTGTRQSSAGIYEVGSQELAEDLLNSVVVGAAEGQTRAFLVHMSEGINRAAIDELTDYNDFQRQQDEVCGPLLDVTSVIHGTAYGLKEFALMSRCGASLIASPLSNILLYGKFPDLLAAKNAGVNTAISTDWSITGSRNLLEELKVVDFINREFYGNALTYIEMVEMVTRNAAEAIGWDHKVGRIETGLFGDLVIIQATTENPYEALVMATERDVQLTVVGGDPLFGVENLMRELKPGDYELISNDCGFIRAIDVTTAQTSVDLGGQKVATIKNRLERAIRLSRRLRGHEVPPLFTCDDRDHFSVLARSGIAGNHFRELSRLASSIESNYR